MSYESEYARNRLETQQEREKKKKEQNQKITRAVIVAVIASVILGVFIGAVSVGNAIGPNYEFQKKVHSHIENAYWASTPELMEDQLNLAIQGMRDLGLTDDLYGKYMPWKQTPDWQMNYCYLHLQAIIERCHEVINWRDNQDLSSGQVTDVYNQKMSNLHNFLLEGGWSDDIAKNAFYVNYHPFYYVWSTVVGAVMLAFVGLTWAKVLGFAWESSLGGYITWVICAILLLIGTVGFVLGK